MKSLILICVDYYVCINFLDSNDVNFRSKITVLENISIKPPMSSSSQSGTSFEDKIMKHLNDLTKAQKSSEERQARMERILEGFMNAQMPMHMQAPGRSTQNETQWHHRKPAHLNDQSSMQGPSRSTKIQTHRQHQEPDHPVYEDIPDFDDFEELDQNFPIEKFENVSELEYNVRKDLELKFLLVILYFHSFATYTECKHFFNSKEISVK